MAIKLNEKSVSVNILEEGSSKCDVKCKKIVKIKNF